jgi:MFS family permease
MSAVGIFFVGGLVCALAWDVGMLLAGGGFQVLASGSLLVLDNIVIADLFSQRSV